MSAKSRARNRFEPAAEPPIDPADQADLDQAMEAFELADINPRAGISKWVGAVLGARERAQAGRGGGNEVSLGAEPSSGATHWPDSPDQPPRALSEPTPYLRAILGGMACKPMYGGTIEPWRVEQRRRRNRAARKSRRANRAAHR